MFSVTLALARSRLILLHYDPPCCCLFCCMWWLRIVAVVSVACSVLPADACSVHCCYSLLLLFLIILILSIRNPLDLDPYPHSWSACVHFADFLLNLVRVCAVDTLRRSVILHVTHMCREATLSSAKRDHLGTTSRSTGLRIKDCEVVGDPRDRFWLVKDTLVVVIFALLLLSLCHLAKLPR